MSLPFTDRRQAGLLLGERVVALGLADPVVLALPRGGVPVAVEVARALAAPLDLLLVRKIGAPWQPEFAVAALAESEQGGYALEIDETLCAELGLSHAWIDEQAREQRVEITRRRRAWLHGRAPLPLAGRNVVVVDDGIATGTTLRAALKALRQRAPSRTVLAVPVAPAESLAALANEVDDVVCLHTPHPFRAVGAFYRHFDQVGDDEVVALLDALKGPTS